MKQYFINYNTQLVIIVNLILTIVFATIIINTIYQQSQLVIRMQTTLQTIEIASLDQTNPYIISKETSRIHDVC